MRSPFWRPALRWLAGTLIVVSAVGVLLVQVSPWPAALLLRWAFDQGDRRAAQALAEHVPSGVTAQLDQPYLPGSADTRLDVFYPEAAGQGAAPRLTVVWIHGGGWLGGSKEALANYARILAAAGFSVVTLGYSLAPAHSYPTPVRQANAALGYLRVQAARLHVAPQLVLAGDSAGAQIAAQLANLITSPAYARELHIAPAVSATQLVGTLLYCGPYALHGPSGFGPRAWVQRVLLWSYSGRRDFDRDPVFRTASVIDYLTPAFPPSFISVGNGDGLAPHSYRLAATLQRLGVPVETLFFPPTQQPPLPHEYQFNLAQEGARQALQQSLAFLTARAAP
jgi:acetyl esterase